MMSDNARSIVLVFDECHTRIQTVSELLLISCIPRPVFTRTDDLALTKENFVRYRDKVIAQLNKMLILSRDISTQVHAKQIQWKSFCHRTQELTTTVINLSELSAHIAYLIAVSTPGSEPAVAGPVTNVHQLTQADLDIRFTCARLKRSRVGDLQPHLLVDLCSTLTKSLTIMTEICRQAAEKTTEANDQDQFKLCVKAITSTTGCLVSSIKSFKHSPSETHLRRVATFCDPVTAASAALLSFASEEGFTGIPAELCPEGLEKYKTIMGLCMSIASANIQICRAVRDLVYSSSSKRHQDRMSLCVESITRSSSQLRDLLLSHEFIAKPSHDTGGKGDSSSETDSQVAIQEFPKSRKDSGSGKECIDNNPDFSQNLLSREKEKSLSPQSPRSSAEKEISKSGVEKELSLSGEEDRVSEGTGDSQRGLKFVLSSVSPSSSTSSSPSSRPSSIAIETAISSIVPQMGSDDSPHQLSPQHFLSSPLSISSSSLASTSSLNVDPETMLGNALTLAESSESVLVLESLEKCDSESKEKSSVEKESIDL